MAAEGTGTGAADFAGQVESSGKGAPASSSRPGLGGNLRGTMRKAMGVARLTAFVLLNFVFFVFAMLLLVLWDSLISFIFILALCALVARVNSSLLSRASRSLQPPAEEIVRDDKRPPVLYLRSFRDDSTVQKTTLGMLNFWFPARRAEDRLVSLLNCLGPFVAIGMPGESLPETGASRFYVDDEQWKSKVAELMSRCRLTLILGRVTTQGVLWEIHEALTTLRPNQLVFFFPSNQSGEDREQQYAAFKESVQQTFPIELPDVLANNYFLRFREGWKPELLGAPIRDPMNAIHTSLLTIIQGLEPGFRYMKPLLWRIESKPRRYAAVAFLGLVLIAVLGSVLAFLSGIFS